MLYDISLAILGGYIIIFIALTFIFNMAVTTGRDSCNEKLKILSSGDEYTHP